jgi:hypothetical protein
MASEESASRFDSMKMLRHNPGRHMERKPQLLLEHLHAARLVVAGLIAVGVGISNLSVGLALQGLQSTVAGLHEASRCALETALPEAADVADVAPSPSLDATHALSA